jgi:uncharacterized membrane-anchored protein
MTLRALTFPLFAALSAAMLYVPGSMIFQYEDVLKNGEVFKFRTQAVDPADIFRGRYVALNFDDATTVTLGEVHYNEEEKVYVRVETKPDGYAHFTEVSRTPPEQGAYLKTKIRWCSDPEKPKGGIGYVNVPFNRYYLDEFMAPEAEKTYREQTRREEKKTYASVRILKGVSAMEELYVKDKPIRQVIQETQMDKKKEKK